MENVAFREKVQAFIGCFLVVTIVIYFFMVTFISHQDDDNNKQVVQIFNTLITFAVGFYLGSSLSSKSKDAIVEEMGKNSTLTVTATKTEQPKTDSETKT